MYEYVFQTGVANFLKYHCKWVMFFINSKTYFCTNGFSSRIRKPTSCLKSILRLIRITENVRVQKKDKKNVYNTRKQYGTVCIRCVYRKTRNLKKIKIRQPKKKQCVYVLLRQKKNNVCRGFTTVEYFVKTKFIWKRVWRTLKVICSLTIGEQKKRKRVKTRGTAYVYCSAVVETTRGIPRL